MSRKIAVAALLFALAGWTLTGTTLAQTGSGFDLSWHVVASGGSPAVGSGFRLESTSGQAAQGPSSGSGFDLMAGYWVMGGQYETYLPVMLR